MKKILSITVLLSLVFIFAACTIDDVNTLINNVVETPEEVYTFSALSSVAILEEEDLDETTSLINGMVPLSVTDEDPLEVEDDLDEVNKYLSFFEKFLSGEEGAFEVTESASDDPAYENMITYTVTDIEGEEHIYVIYYTEVVVTGSEEENEDGETLTETTLVGKLVIDGVEYLLEGTREIEDGEYKITFISKIDDENCVTVVQKVEDGEQKFMYEVKIQNQIRQRTEVKVSSEDNETKVQMKFTEGDAVGEYEFKHEVEDGEECIKIYYNNNGEEGEIKVRVGQDENGEKTYEYQIQANNKVVTQEKAKGLNKDSHDNGQSSDQTNNSETGNNF